MSWALGKRFITRTHNYIRYLAEWSKRMSSQEVAEAFSPTWHHVFCPVDMAVIGGRRRQDLPGIASMGVDEIQLQKGLKSLTVVYQINEGRKRFLRVCKHRYVKILIRFFWWLSKERSSELRNVCSDMWRSYLKVIQNKAVDSINILARYQVMVKMITTICTANTEVSRRMKAAGFELLLTRYCFNLLKRPEYLNEEQDIMGDLPVPESTHRFF